MDYLFGDQECETPDDEQIHAITGLSGPAIKKLKALSEKAGQNSDLEEKKLAVLNCLIANMDNTSFLENLYGYLLGKFVFPSSHGSEPAGATVILSRSPSGKVSRQLIFSEYLSEAMFSKVQIELVHLKDCISKQNELKEEYEYRKWAAEHRDEYLPSLPAMEDTVEETETK